MPTIIIFVTAGHGLALTFVAFTVEALEFEADELPSEVKTTEKDTALRMAISQLAGDFTKESMLSLQRFFRTRRASVVSTGSLKLDQALGVGGLPKVMHLNKNIYSVPHFSVSM